MDNVFITIIQTLIAERGKDALLDVAKAKSLLADYARGEFPKERRLLLQTLEAGVGKAIDGAQDLQICKRQQVRMLTDEHFLAEPMAADVVNMLAFVLRGDIAKKPVKQPVHAPAVPVGTTPETPTTKPPRNTPKKLPTPAPATKQAVVKSAMVKTVTTPTPVAKQEKPKSAKSKEEIPLPVYDKGKS
jgi:hypothetical protein